MKHSEFFSCDLCSKEYEKYAQVAGDVSVSDSRTLKVYSDVCDNCARKVSAFITSEFPKSRTIMRSVNGVLAEKQTVC